MADRDEAERRVRQIEAFRAEWDRLTTAGVGALTVAQREAIATHHDALLRQFAERYDVDRTAAAAQFSRGMQLASFLGAVTLTAAIYSLVERVWGRLDFPMQATLLCLFPLAALVGVELSARRERTLYVSALFAIVAYGTFWLAVGVLADLTNIPLTTHVIWAGVLFGVALALPYGFRLVLAASLVALVVAVSGSFFQGAGVPWTVALEKFDVTAGVAFAVTLLARPLGRVDAAFAPTTRVTGLVGGFAGLLLLSSSGQASLVPVADGTIEAVYQAIMLVATVTALVFGVRRGWRDTVRVGAVALTLFLLVRYVDWFWDALPPYVFFFGLAALAFGWLLALRRLRARVTGANLEGASARR
jgi:hypothetical protein